MTLRSVGIDRRLYGASVFTHWTLPPPPRHMIVCRLYNTHEPMHAHTVNKLKERRLKGGGERKRSDGRETKEAGLGEEEEEEEDEAGGGKRKKSERVSSSGAVVGLLNRIGKKSQGPPAAWLDMSLSLAPIAPSPITRNP